MIFLSSESVEEYLEAIYSFNEKGKLARTTALSKKLKVTPPSVTQMIKKLADEGLVEYEPYKGAMLTGRGMAHAQKVVRKHRLLERFLHDFLGLSRNKVHDEACRMEHGLSDEAAAALCKALDKPETCPDDEKIIPPCPLDVSDCDDCAAVREEGSLKLLTQLSNLKPGEEGIIAFIRAGNRAYQRLLDMGLTKGTRVRVLNSAPFQGPIGIEIRGSNLALGRGLAGHVFIEIQEEKLTQDRSHPHGPHH
ncbi:HTH-type transcriptional regulator MntR [subsurface metagenome]